MPDPRPPIAPGVLGRLIQGVRYAITGVDQAGWFQPGEPLQPVAPDYVAGRAWDFPVGYNLAIRPRAWEGNGFEDLKVMADAWDVIRLLIETRKDQIARLSWSIRLRQNDKRRIGARSSPGMATDAEGMQIQEFFEYPDKRNDWASWLRMLMEQVLVYDAPAIYPVRTRGGDLYSLEILDGSTIAPRINPDGRIPSPPDVAYQQILKGLPAVDYTSDELIYWPRNKRIDRVYGFSPVEQILTTINIALRRQASQLYYFTAGTNPDAFIYCPPEWNATQIREFQEYFDSTFEGDLAARRRTKFMPGAGQYQEVKAPPLKDDFDEWLTRIACYAFSLPPQWAVRQMNRASAQQQASQANEEGLFPYMLWIKGLADRIIRHQAGRPQYEFVWELDTYASPAERVTILTKYVMGGVMTPNEARDELGLPPLDNGDVLYMPSAMANIEDIFEGVELGGGGGGGSAFGSTNGRSSVTPTPHKTDTRPAGSKSVSEGVKAPVVQKAEVAEPGDRPFAPSSHGSYPEHYEKVHLGRRLVRHETHELRGALRAEFAAIAATITERAAAALQAVNKANPDALPHEHVLVDQILANLGLAGLLAALAPIIAHSLEAVAAGTARGVLETLGVSQAALDAGLAAAILYADERSAELIGHARNLAGDLIADPSAALVMTDSTHDRLEDMLDTGLEEGLTGESIAASLAAVFTDERADKIAEFEVNRASNEGVLAALVAAVAEQPALRKYWVALINCCQRCAANAAVGPIGVTEVFPSGDSTPGAHPYCRCELLWK